MESKEKLGWSLSPAGNVVLTMTRYDYDNLLLALGAAAAALNANGVVPLRLSLALCNRLNDGNPNYTSYAVADRPYEVGAEDARG